MCTLYTLVRRRLPSRSGYDTDTNREFPRAMSRVRPGSRAKVISHAVAAFLQKPGRDILFNYALSYFLVQNVCCTQQKSPSKFMATSLVSIGSNILRGPLPRVIVKYTGISVARVDCKISRRWINTVIMLPEILRLELHVQPLEY